MPAKRCIKLKTDTCFITSLMVISSPSHPGDSDSTAVIACCCWGLLYGTQGVPEGNYSNLEYRDRLERSAEQLYALSHWEGRQSLLDWQSLPAACTERKTRPRTPTHWRRASWRARWHINPECCHINKVWCHTCLKVKQSAPLTQRRAILSHQGLCASWYGSEAGVLRGLPLVTVLN